MYFHRAYLFYLFYIKAGDGGWVENAKGISWRVSPVMRKSERQNEGKERGNIFGAETIEPLIIFMRFILNIGRESQ
jgi:hypothetical protein